MIVDREHAEIAPGHHGSAGNFEYRLKVSHALGVLDLRDDRDVGAAFFEDLANVQHVRGAANERGGDVLDVVVHGEGEILDIFGADAPPLEAGLGDVHALAIRQHAAADDFAADRVGADVDHPEFDTAIAEEDRAADFDFTDQFGVGDGDTARSAEPAVGVEIEGSAVDQFGGVTAEVLAKLKEAVIEYDEDISKEYAQIALDEGMNPNDAIFNGLVSGMEEVAIRATHVIFCRRARSSTQDHLATHEFAVIFPNSPWFRVEPSIRRIRTGGPLPDIAKQSGEGVFTF